MSRPVTSRAQGLYVHFPYCEKKCPYCDFNSHVIPHDDQRYADAILRELADRAPPFLARGGFSTLYFGGGTPSLWAAEAVGRVIQAARAELGLSADAEITLEANPGTIHERSFAAFVEVGVNRFSIGAQSFVASELVSLGRIHDNQAAARAVRLAKATGARVSLDLMYAQPGQRWSDVQRSVEAALALEPDHVSAYTLTVEPSTPLGHRFEAGTFVPMEDDEQAELIERVTAALEAAGHLRYEVSSYARPGFEARHNSIYWAGGAYLGVGAGAHSHFPGPGLREVERRGNIKSPTAWEEQSLAGSHTPGFLERLTQDEAIAERAMLGVRVAAGLDLAELAEDAGLPFEALWGRFGSTLEALVQEGLLERRGSVFSPTKKGFFFTDGMGRRLLQARPT
ncbi:MAG: radical SAM family heme chaperone HemW [Myxococcota bacterium]